MDEQERRAEAIRLIQTTDRFYTDIAREVGLSPHVVRNLARRRNLRPVRHDDVEEEWRQYNEQKANAVALLRAGATIKTTVQRTGLSTAVTYGLASQPEVRECRSSQDIYIYALCCPVSRQAFYVGSAKNPWVRYYKHVSDAHSAELADWVKALQSIGKTPKLKILEHAWTKDRFGLERTWIMRLVEAGHPLINREAK